MEVKCAAHFNNNQKTLGNIKWILKKYNMVVYTDTLYTVVTWQLAERERRSVQYGTKFSEVGNNFRSKL
jgi:hypothetical protein